MADQKIVDKTSTKMSKMYKQGIKEIVETMISAKGKLTDAEFAKDIKSINMSAIVKEKFKDISSEFTSAHAEVLKTINAFGDTKKND